MPSRNGSSMSNHSSRQRSPAPSAALQSTDFPPLSATEKRPSVVAGAWTNASSTRSILITSPNPNPSNLQANALVYHPNGIGAGNMAHSRLEESDHSFERPPPKGELYNPKVVKRPVSNGRTSSQEKDKARTDAVNIVLTEKIRALTLDHGGAEGSIALSQSSKELSVVPVS